MLHVVESVAELLHKFDVDCAAVAFEPATSKTYMSPRAKRAFETGCNILDSRFNSPTYAERLWKYAKRGFAVAVPGLDINMVSPRVANDNYVFVQDKDILLRLDKLGDVGSKKTHVDFDGQREGMTYVRCDETSVVDGLLKLVVMDRRITNRNVRNVSLPVIKECERCAIRAVEPATNTASPLLVRTGVPRKYHLLWGAGLSTDDMNDISWMDDDFELDRGDFSDVAGYTCTPLARAYDLFSHLLDMSLFEEEVCTSGVVSRLSHRMTQQNGEVAASMCRRHCDMSRRISSSKVGFAWDFINVMIDGFDTLKGVFDAGFIPSLTCDARLSDDAFEQKHGFPRYLEFKRAVTRRPIEIDWFRDVY